MKMCQKCSFYIWVCFGQCIFNQESHRVLSGGLTHCLILSFYGIYWQQENIQSNTSIL